MFSDRRLLRKLHDRIRVLANVNFELVTKDVVMEWVGQLGPQILPGFRITIDNIEGLISGQWLQSCLDVELGVEARISKAVEAGVEWFRFLET